MYLRLYDVHDCKVLTLEFEELSRIRFFFQNAFYKSAFHPIDCIVLYHKNDSFELRKHR